MHSVNPIERLNGEIKRRTEVVGIFPNDATVVRLVGALLLEQNDEWTVQPARYMTLETIAPSSDDPSSACQQWPADQPGLAGERGDHAVSYTTRWDTIIGRTAFSQNSLCSCVEDNNFGADRHTVEEVDHI